MTEVIAAAQHSSSLVMKPGCGLVPKSAILSLAGLPVPDAAG